MKCCNLNTTTTTHGWDGIIGSAITGRRDTCNENETGELDDRIKDGENDSRASMRITRKLTLYYCGKCFKEYRSKEPMQAHEVKCCNSPQKRQ